MVGPSWEQVLAGAGGVAERHILSAAGLSPLHRQRLVADGALVEVCVGTTALVAWPGVPTGPLGALRLAVTAAGPLAFAHRRSAAALWGLDGFCEGVDGQPPWAGPPATPEVGIHRERSARGPGVHRVSGLRPGDVVRHLGIRTTAVARTLVDLGAVCPPDQVEWSVESALRSGLVDLPALLDPELVAGRWRGRVLARRAA